MPAPLPTTRVPPSSYDRVVPLIVAVALFMENMDSTVIATSLPAIARALGTNPLALKLAVTSYLLALAICIPASGWTADRFGARHIFRIAIGVFVLGSIGCALSRSLEEFVIGGIDTTIALQQRIIGQQEFIDGDYDIHWLERWIKAQEA